MRIRARRRLAGAVALVLAAVIVLPMFLDSEPKPIPATVEVTIPDRNSPFNPQLTAAATTDAVRGAVDAGSGVPAAQQNQGVAPGNTISSPQVAQTGHPTGQIAGVPGTASPADKPSPEPKPQTESKPPVQSAGRTDDGSRALALLAGRAPTAPSPGAAAASSGSGFVVQVASYSTETDAHARRDKLRSEGVTNAFVESTIVNGKPTFRLRVGPFSSRDAAQAAQTRLRSLGYPTGFLATQ